MDSNSTSGSRPQSGPPVRDALESALSLHCDSNMKSHAELTPHQDLRPSTGIEKIAILAASEAYSNLWKSSFLLHTC